MIGSHKKPAPIVPDTDWRQEAWYTAPCRALWGPDWRSHDGWGENAQAKSLRASINREARGDTGTVQHLANREQKMDPVYTKAKS